MDEREAMARLAGLISGIPIAMLTTVTEGGSLHSRPMATQKLPITNELLFLSGEHTGKADEVRIEHEVALTYSIAHLYVAVSGRGAISNDRAMIRALWMQIFDARFRGSRGSSSTCTGGKGGILGHDSECFCYERCDSAVNAYEAW